MSADKVSFHLATLLQLVKRTPGSHIIYFRVQLGVGKDSPLLLALRPSCSRLARSRLVAPPRFSFKAGCSAQSSHSRLLAPPRISWSCLNSAVYLNSLAGHRGSCMSAALAGGGTAYDAFEVQVLLDLSWSMQPSEIRGYGVNAYALPTETVVGALA